MHVADAAYLGASASTMEMVRSESAENETL